jgi:hypothetical protein
MSAMIEDVQLEQIPAPSLPVPLCDEDDEPATGAHKPEDLELTDDDVEAHGGSGFTEPA